MAFGVPRGFRVAGVHCGIKNNASKLDLSLVVGEDDLVASGVYTQNRIFAAPVAWDRARTPSSSIRVLVANSGNANACTGDRGMQDTQEMAGLAAACCNASADQALVLSTGIIGEFLPMENIRAGIQAAAEQLGDDHQSLLNAACGILTTDVRHKMAGRTLEVDGHAVQVLGFAKGAGMIGPNMATMLGVVLTDARLSQEAAQRLIQLAADVSFNCISVEGHTSTNDTLLLLASGKSGTNLLEGEDLEALYTAVRDVCIDLARMIPDDGEGASHLVTIDVRGCATRAAARQVAQTVANSALVKTAVAGADPNWGRIVSAVGYAQIPFDPAQLSLWMNETLLYQNGEPVTFDRQAVSKSIREHRETHIELSLGQGEAEARFWTSDLTVDYVKLNADYHT